MAHLHPPRRGRVLVAIAGVVTFAACLGPTAGEVALPALDKSVEKPLGFAAGTELEFAVHVDDYEYSGANHILLDVTLLKSGNSVGTMHCAGVEFEGGAGCGSGATHLNSSCSMNVPAGGSDAIRIVASLEEKTQPVTVK